MDIVEALYQLGLIAAGGAATVLGGWLRDRHSAEMRREERRDERRSDARKAVPEAHAAALNLAGDDAPTRAEFVGELVSALSTTRIPLHALSLMDEDQEIQRAAADTSADISGVLDAFRQFSSAVRVLDEAQQAGESVGATATAKSDEAIDNLERACASAATSLERLAALIR